MLKVIRIEDFSGGRNSFDDQVLIPQNVCSSGTSNVWAPGKALTKAAGYTLQASFTATASGNAMPWIMTDDAVSTTNKVYYRIAAWNTATATGSSYALFGSPVAFTDSLNALGYVTGTVSISGANLISATGNGTTWSTHVSAGDRFSISSTASWYKISSVEDNTHLTLSNPVPAAIATGTTYIAQPLIDVFECNGASLNGLLCMCSTANIMQQYDGSNIKRVSAAPKAAFLATHKNYLFTLRTSTNPSRLQWCDIGDPTTWGSNNYIDIDLLNGIGAGLISYGSELIIFKTRGMYKVLGDVFDPTQAQYFVIKIPTPPDFVFNSNRTVVIHGGPNVSSFGGAVLAPLIFYAGGRIYMYRAGSYGVVDISRNIIRDLPTSFSNLTDYNGTDQDICGISYNGYYIIKGLPDPNGSGGSGMMMVMDPNGAWWYWKNPNAANSIDVFDKGLNMVVIPSTTSKPQLAVGSQGIPHVYTWDFIGPSYGSNFYSTSSSTYAATTTAINSVWVSKEFNIEFGTFKDIKVYLQKQSSGSVALQWSIDQGAYVSNSISMTSGRGNIIRAVLPVNQRGSTIQLKVTHNTASEIFKIYAIEITYETDADTRLR